MWYRLMGSMPATWDMPLYCFLYFLHELDFCTKYSHGLMLDRSRLNADGKIKSDASKNTYFLDDPVSNRLKDACTPAFLKLHACARCHRTEPQMPQGLSGIELQIIKAQTHALVWVSQLREST